jgi:hypothetical protein
LQLHNFKWQWQCKRQQQKDTELPSSWQALPKLSMQQFGIIALHYWYYSHQFKGRVGCGVSGEYFLLLLDSTLSSKTHYKMQNKYFLPGFHKKTKYCVMRECENILHRYLYGGDLLFVILKGIYGFEFPKRFMEISSRDLTLLSILII